MSGSRIKNRATLDRLKQRTGLAIVDAKTWHRDFIIWASDGYTWFLDRDGSLKRERPYTVDTAREELRRRLERFKARRAGVDGTQKRPAGRAYSGNRRFDTRRGKPR